MRWAQMSSVSQPKSDRSGHPTLSTSIYPCNLRRGFGVGVPTKPPTFRMNIKMSSIFGQNDFIEIYPIPSFRTHLMAAAIGITPFLKPSA